MQFIQHNVCLFQIMGDSDWRVKPHLFTAELLANPSDKHLIHAEYRFSFLTKQTATGPQLLIATAVCLLDYSTSTN